MNPQDHSKTFLFLGDSLIDRKSIVTIDPCYDLPAIGEPVTVLHHQTGGFYKLLMEMLQLTYPHNKIKFESAARGGATSQDLESQLTSFLENSTAKEQCGTTVADTIFICVGTNDASHMFFGLGEDISIDQFKNSYELIVESLSDKSKSIYCILPPPVRTQKDSACINKKIAEYNDALSTLETLYDHVTLVDLYTHFESIDSAYLNDNPELTLRLDDGVHLSNLGNQLAANIIWDSLILEDE